MALKDKVVVVTGAARGMGRAFVDGFLEAGAKVVGLDLSWRPSGASNDDDDGWTSGMASRGDVLTLTCDITHEDEVKQAYEAAIARFGTVHALCNNAGMLQRHLFPPGGPVSILDDTTNNDFRKMYEVSVFGTLLVTRYFVQPMRKQKSGSIFSVASNGVLLRSEDGAYSLFRPTSREQPYMSSKAALTNVMCFLGEELREENIAVNILLPLHTRSTGFDEWEKAYFNTGGRQPQTPYHPNHLQPIGCFLADQNVASGNTAKVWNASVWLPEQGYPLAQWLSPDPKIW